MFLVDLSPWQARTTATAEPQGNSNGCHRHGAMLGCCTEHGSHAAAQLESLGSFYKSPCPGCTPNKSESFQVGPKHEDLK